MQKGIIKNVNKLTGESIDAKDLASMLSGIIGNESGVLTVFDELRLEKISDNKVRLHSGVYSLKGHILYIPKGSYEDFEIESGTLGANRIDLLVAEYVKNGEGDGEDTLRFRVIKGEATSGTPKEPPLIKQDINENGITYQEIIYKLYMKNQSMTKISQLMFIKGSKNLEKELTDKIESVSDDFKSSIAYYSSTLEIGTDLNKVKHSSFYRLGGSGHYPNSPGTSYGILLTFSAGGYVVQLLFNVVNDSVFLRMNNGSIWHAWKSVF